MSMLDVGIVAIVTFTVWVLFRVFMNRKKITNFSEFFDVCQGAAVLWGIGFFPFIVILLITSIYRTSSIENAATHRSTTAIKYIETSLNSGYICENNSLYFSERGEKSQIKIYSEKEHVLVSPKCSNKGGSIFLELDFVKIPQ